MARRTTTEGLRCRGLPCRSAGGAGIFVAHAPFAIARHDGLFELRFDLNRQAFRITYYFATGRRIVLLTVFRKQRMNERHEVNRARDAMARCIRERHAAEEDDE